MESSRTLVLKKRPKFILNKSFPVFKELTVGDSGQMLIEGSVIAEQLEFQEEVDLIVKTVEIDNAEIITNKNARNI